MAEPRQKTNLRRECAAVRIPSGETVTLEAGLEVTISQALGDSFTVTTERGMMARIGGRDADALGLAAPSGSADAEMPATPEEVERCVWDMLRHCYDPEIPVNIVDLGLVYGCDVAELPTGEYTVLVRFTLTTPACGMAGVLQADIEDKAESVPGVKRCDVEIVFDPPWDQSRMSEAAKLELGML